MLGIEKYQDEKFEDVLPTEAYFDIEKKKKDILNLNIETAYIEQEAKQAKNLADVINKARGI